MIAENLKKILQDLPDSVKLIAVSKTHPEEDILEAYQAGQRTFGENKVQELARKHENLPQDIEWHMIGHLQRNKIKYIAPFVHLIHSVDSERLLQAINKEAQKCNRVIQCLLQIHIAKESTKFGFDEDELRQVLSENIQEKYENVKVVGLMGMATFTDDEELIRKEFSYLANLYDKIKINYFNNNDAFRELSMGMSDDYSLAIEAGSTMVRIGSNIFGERNYNK